MGQLLFIVISILVSLTACIIAHMAFDKKRVDGMYLGITLIIAACICMFYLVSVMVDNRFVMSLFSSMLFSCMDLMLISLYLYIRVFITGRHKLWNKPSTIVPAVYAAFDIVILMINPWHEIALTYQYSETSIAHWRYDPWMLYQLHLAFSYVMIVVIIVYLLHKIVNTPAAYRTRYINIMIAVLVVVFMNALFLFLPNNNLFDFSVLFYSAAGFILYWNNYNYSKNGMFNKTRQLIVDELNHPMLLFDYEKQFVMDNRAMRELFEIHNFDGKRAFNLCDFIHYCGFSEITEFTDKDTSFRWIAEVGGVKKIYRIDYHVLKEEKNRDIGYLFMFTDNSLELDILTGFHNINEFKRHFREDEGAASYPLSVSVCDINNLYKINREYGEVTGDAAIKELAACMQNRFPEEAYFVRLNEATLAAVSKITSHDQLKEITSLIGSDLAKFDQVSEPMTIQSAVSIVDGIKNEVIGASETAVASMKAKKLLDKNSAHSSLLDSLVQTLRESDDETEAHVRRTNALGQQLSERLKLSDREKNNLALLCMLHDIGKVGIPLEILNKPGRLNNEEWQIMKSHAEKGYRIARASHELDEIADLILHHHECWNGSGYPYGLKGEEIPLLSRIIAIVDTYDAMTSDRVYRKAVSHSEAIAELKRCAGTQFDPHLVDEFLIVLKNNCSEDIDIDAIEPESIGSSISKPAGIEEATGHNPYKKSSSRQLIYSRYILDSDNHIIEVDANFEILTGYSRGQVRELGLSQSDLICEEDWEEYQNIVAEAISKHHEAYIEHRLLRADGRIITVHCLGTEFFNAVSREGRTDIVITQIDD